MVVSAEELNVGAEQVKAWLTQCLVPSHIPPMPATRSVSCSGDVITAQLLICSEYFLLAARPFGRVVSSCLLYLKTVTKTAVLGSPCSDRCEGEGNVSEGL